MIRIAVFGQIAQFIGARGGWQRRQVQAGAPGRPGHGQHLGPVARMHGDVLATLQAAGSIRRWGVSNFDVGDMEELVAISEHCAVNQVWQSLGARAAEFALLLWLRARHMPLMAYSPIDQRRAARDPVLNSIAAARGLTAMQVALAFLLAQPGVIAIPKASRAEHWPRTSRRRAPR